MTTHVRRLFQSVIVAGVVVALGCADAPTAPDSDLTQAKRSWMAKGPSSYDITVGKSCFCAFEAAGPVVVSVRNGVVESRHYALTGARVGEAFVSLYPTVDELFAQIDGAVAANSYRVDVRYDPVLGYPTTVVIDGALNIADDEYDYGVTAFVAR